MLLLFSCLRDTVLLVLVVLCAMRLCGAGMSHGCATSVQVHQPMSTSSSVTDLFFFCFGEKKKLSVTRLCFLASLGRDYLATSGESLFRLTQPKLAIQNRVKSSQQINAVFVCFTVEYWKSNFENTLRIQTSLIFCVGFCA